MEICPTDICTGCFACANACSQNCISMMPDDYGVIHPVIDESKCINCGFCKKACPNNVYLDFKSPIQCFASWVSIIEKRLTCASGGIGTAMAEYVISIGGVVFGSCYDENLTPVISHTDYADGIEKFKGSKYVHSLVGNKNLREVREFLKTGRLVLFIGTPCQVAGLRAFLRKDYDNLITVDLICHGVCPNSYLKDEIAYLTEKYEITDVADIRFRGNDGNNFRLTLWNKNRRKLFPRDNFREKLFRLSEAQQFYIRGFLLGVTMRENCYSCKYARPERVSDITIGDFIGLGKKTPFPYPEIRNISSVLLNTTKGQSFYEKVSATNSTLVNVEREYSERLEYRPSLLEAYKRHPLNSKFKHLYLKYGFHKAIRKTLGAYMCQKQMYLYCTIVKRVLKRVYSPIKHGKL